jgi:prepilin-type N-terminal cleavage/methylation domain-containing protein
VIRSRAARLCRAPRRSLRRAFNLPELLIAVAINAVLMLATFVALHASFQAYQTTTEVAATHTIARLAMHRMLTLIRTGSEFGPFPSNPLDSTVHSDYIEFQTTGLNPQIILLEWDQDENALYMQVTDVATGVQIAREPLLNGVLPQYDAEEQLILPFTLQFSKGKHLYRATIDLSVLPDDDLDLEIEGDQTQLIRLVASGMPRTAAYD